MIGAGDCWKGIIPKTVVTAAEDEEDLAGVCGVEGIGIQCYN